MKKIYFLILAFCLYTTVNAQIINIPDVSLKTKLLAINPSSTTIYARGVNGDFLRLDLNNDGQIQLSEAGLVYSLIITQTSDITSLVGIEQFYNLREFVFHRNSGAITTVNLQNMLYLEDVNFDTNNIDNLNLGGNVNLKYLTTTGSSGIDNLDLTGSLNLIRMQLYNEVLPSINVQNYTNLTNLVCTVQNSINVQGCVNLSSLSVWAMDIFNTDLNLNLNDCVNLTSLSIRGGNLTTLDVQDSPNLSTLNCTNLPFLENLLIKNGIDEVDLNFRNCPQLKYICADESQLENVQIKIDDYGYTNCFVNSYCSFVPGGNFYTVQGNSKWDFNNNGCDTMDFNVQHLKFFINSSAGGSGSLISDASGNYSIPVVAGTHTIIPLFENNYFISTPSNRIVNFPSNPSPVTQDFCIRPNGVHPDLEISILPLAPARPGFDAEYKIIYRNKGNTTQSGTVNLVFNDDVLDLISANPVVTTQTINNLTWDFANLFPFESREISFTLNLNSPVEIPAVNVGDVLNYTATVTSSAIDDKPNDNTFVFNQTVVNSYDPNDKTCLEGATILPTKVGDYVHYMIRFENNGTAIAQNIVVKDIIDTSKFDTNTLVPISGSHSFKTKILRGYIVEFIFENINLPFDDANNDGYVAFKIKTKPTLVLGNTFSNSASIYFDYNFPIVTNTATTTIAALSTKDFEFSNYFSLYPNPVSDVLNITSKETIEISSINIYNTLGQLVLVIPNAQETKTVDVSSLTSGNYFIKINSDKGTSNTKFVKQ